MFSGKWISEIITTEQDKGKLREKARERLLEPVNLKSIAVVMTHFPFRDGPGEDMHAEGKLSDKDMMTLIKHMMNTLSLVIELIQNQEYEKLEPFFAVYGSM